ncbi:MAG: hypothetical protein H7A21_13255 [Spirochaetales bacterium]|nr:hypothetical protein [Spirochaetales bacterium]MCP5484165.1 hypothetical protein [Spirochaetales bacterium]
MRSIGLVVSLFLACISNVTVDYPSQLEPVTVLPQTAETPQLRIAVVLPPELRQQDALSAALGADLTEHLKELCRCVVVQTESPEPGYDILVQNVRTTLQQTSEGMQTFSAILAALTLFLAPAYRYTEVVDRLEVVSASGTSLLQFRRLIEDYQGVYAIYLESEKVPRRSAGDDGRTQWPRVYENEASREAFEAPYLQYVSAAVLYAAGH